MGELFKGKTEWLVALAMVAMVCLTVLGASGAIDMKEVIAAIPGVIAAVAAGTAAARASRAHDAAEAAHDKIDDALSPCEPKPTQPSAPKAVVPPPASTLPLWIWPVSMVALLATAGCGSLDSQYVAADAATYQAVAPLQRHYLAADRTLDEPTRARRLRTLETWRIRLEQAGAPLSVGPEAKP